MALQRWDPFGEMGRMDETLNRLWRGFGRDFWTPTEAEATWGLPLDVRDDGDAIAVQASVPGVKPEDLQVLVEAGVLAIRAETKVERDAKQGDYLVQERRYGTFARTIRLPDVVDADKATSTYEHGVLTIRFPKLEARKARRLTVTVGGSAKSAEGVKP